jgi:hypothetical protein
VGQNGEEVEGNPFRSSPWSGTDCGGGSTGGGGLEVTVVRGGGAQRLTKGRELVVAVQGKVGSCTGLFIGVGRRWLGRAEHAELMWPSMAVGEKSWRGLGRRDSR